MPVVPTLASIERKKFSKRPQARNATHTNLPEETISRPDPAQSTFMPRRLDELSHKADEITEQDQLDLIEFATISFLSEETLPPICRLPDHLSVNQALGGSKPPPNHGQGNKRSVNDAVDELLEFEAGLSLPGIPPIFGPIKPKPRGSLSMEDDG